MSKLYEVIGQSEARQLLADPQGADRIAVPLTPGKGNLPAGTVLFRETNGMYSPAASADCVTTNFLAVLAEDMDTGETVEPGAVAEDAVAYRAGIFANGKVFLASKAALSEANKVVLRKQGIVFDRTDAPADAFDNSTVTITYKANNGADPAEADYAVGELKGATHTVLANTVTNFTAPDTKSFSKWNTKADGSGTDYAAAASYTANADLVLYAVWA